MQGLVFDGNRQVSLHDFPDPKPGPGEVVIRITASGLCGSDLHYYRSPSPLVPAVIGGHEPAGVVEELGEGVDPRSLPIGRRVMVSHYAGCGTCSPCRTGWTQMCASGAVVYSKHAHGGHAPYMLVSAASLLPLDERISDTAAAAIGCGTGTAWGAIDRLGDVGGRDLVVFGQGPVGHSATMLATARGARVIAVDLTPGRLDQAKEFGAAETVRADDPDAVEIIRSFTQGGAPLTLETSGASSAARAALEVSAPWGRICVVGLGGSVEIDVRQYLSRQLTVMTSWSMSTVQQLACADFVARKGIPVDRLFSHRWSLDQATDAYADFDTQTSGKAVFLF